VLLAWMLAFTVVVVPSFKFLKYLATSPKLTHLRGRTIGVTVALIAAVLGPLAWMPMPDRIRARITPPDFYIGFIPGVISTVIGTALSGIGIYRRQTSRLFKELEA
jgi:putative ABC transport system permease protein